MANLITSTALLCVLLVIIANAVTGYRTIITTVEVDDSSNVRDICKKEAERRDLSSCENYITQRRGRSEDMLAMPGIENPRQQVPRQCCNQAKELSAICRCESIHYLLEKQLEEGEVGSEDEARRRTKNIIDVCFGSICPR
ncbi:hypothetical protein JCGZ_00818 [Jatropha curcas]|uniref:Bifunctional inhibitor/plant lipid transfer protein/seed storage helical domain-containing protein n=1 Tax=Jatropha curcas TaxID=180498 RepID=A0A067KS63_JATCU|nr:2S albumin [Jatropha curcas]KDP39061.1 hypothetical protein JCGZ_00818 [Jatropha curcas]